MKTIIGVGETVNRNRGKVTGLAMMHELTLSVAKDFNYRVKSISLDSRILKSDTRIASPGFARFIDYLLIFVEVFWNMLVYRKAIVYVNPATTVFGLKRDYILTKMAKVFGHSVLFQQFGAMFTSFYNSLSASNQKKLEYTYNAVDKIIVEGEFAKSQYPFIRDQNKVVVVNNGLPELEQYFRKKEKQYHKGDSFRLFFMNNMIESKGYVDVLKAIDVLVNQRKYDIVCCFAGRFLKVPDDQYFSNTNEAQAWFEEFIEKHNLGDRVEYLSSVFGKEKAKIFSQSHVFLLPSYYIYEGQPTAILEAMSYGCVPIVTNYRLIPDMVDESCGIFVFPKSPKSIADAIETLINNPTYYNKLSTRSINKFNEKFTREKYSERMQMIFASL